MAERVTPKEVGSELSTEGMLLKEDLEFEFPRRRPPRPKKPETNKPNDVYTYDEVGLP